MTKTNSNRNVSYDYVMWQLLMFHSNVEHSYTDVVSRPDKESNI